MNKQVKVIDTTPSVPASLLEICYLVRVLPCNCDDDSQDIIFGAYRRTFFLWDVGEGATMWQCAACGTQRDMAVDEDPLVPGSRIADEDTTETGQTANEKPGPRGSPGVVLPSGASEHTAASTACARMTRKGTIAGPVHKKK